ncbi:hypothetical protein AB0M39_14725 [Streptomyces sp. NPDC051907]
MHCASESLSWARRDAIIAVSLADELDLGRIERFLALAWESGE